MLVSFEKALIARALMSNFIEANKAESKAIWRIRNRVLKPFNKSIEKYQELVDDIRTDNALVGKNKELLYSETQDGRQGTLLFSKEGNKIVKDAIKELLKKENGIEITTINWSVFSPKEQQWFVLDDEETYSVMSLFIEGLPEQQTEF